MNIIKNLYIFSSIQDNTTAFSMMMGIQLMDSLVQRAVIGVKQHLNVQKRQKGIFFQLTTMDHLVQELKSAVTHVRHA
jgi:hypothetical protein